MRLSVNPRYPAGGQAWWLLAFATPLLIACHALAGTPPAATGLTLTVAVALVIVVHLRCPPLADGLGRANRVTLLRGFIVALLAGFLLVPSVYLDHGLWLAGLIILALGLDGVDGWLARRHGEVSSFGARFDMEVDAALMLVVSAALVLGEQFGPWVLAIGLMRYLFVAAGRILPWIDRPLPDRLRRKLVCVVQVVALIAALLPMLPASLRTAGLALALLALLASFAADLRWLYHQRPVVNR
jgi:phosphatidylglycerophosphate synthase